MRFAKTLSVLGLVCVLSGAAGQASGQQSPDEKAMMEAMMKASTPGPEHQMLAATAGTWKTTTKMWGAPGQPPAESTGQAVITSVLGGRYVHESFKGEMMGMPFEGSGLSGYDNIQKKYVGTWCDTWGTAIMTTTGTYDAATKTFSYSGTYPDPMTGKFKTMKMSARTIDANNHVAEFWDQTPDGKYVKTMEISYTRQ